MIGFLLWAVAAHGVTPEVTLRHAAILAYSEYTDCLRDKAIGIELKNGPSASGHLSPRDVARSAIPLCKPEWEAFASVFLGGIASPSAEDIESLDYFRGLGVGMAATEIEVVRKGSCGLLPGPYQCEAFKRH